MLGVNTQEIIKQAKLELARREFFFYCHLTAPSFYKKERQFLVDLCNEFQSFIETEGEEKDDVLVINVPP